MNKREVTEIKRRLKKESCTITRMAGCYVDSSKEKVLTFNNNFLNLEDIEFHKYLEIANKCLSGKLGNNLLDLSFDPSAEEAGGPQHSILALRDSGLKDENMLNAFYDHVIETYDTVNNYLILLFHDAYDVPMKSTDELSLGESDEVYEYILCAICPVNLSKPGLGYHPDDNSIAALDRSWVVGATESAFLFPAFNERSADIHSAFVYTKNTKEPHKEFWELGLGCVSRFTSAEKQNAFNNMVKHAVGGDEEKLSDILTDVSENISAFIEEEAATSETEEPIILSEKEITPILTDSGLSEEQAEKVSKEFKTFFNEEPPEAGELLDSKLLKDSELKNEKKALQEKVVELENELERSGLVTKNGEKADIVVNVNDEKAELISAGFVDGQRCLIIPLEADDETTINGELQYF